MIQYFMDMPLESQTKTVLAIGWVLLIVSAAIREKIVSTECRNWARLMGVIGAGLLSLQTIHATMVVEELNKELMVRQQHQKSSEISSESVIAVTTTNGNKIEFGVSKNGMRVGTAVSRHGSDEFTDSPDAEGSRCREFAAVDMGRNGRSDTTYDGFNASAKLSEWWRHTWSRGPDGGNEARFNLPRKVSGEDF